VKITSCRFEAAAGRPQDAPRSRGPRVVLLGRSNVGKSTLINRLVGARGLARTSSQPGRTQTINFYRVNDAWYLVDLPGYGYAKVPAAVREAWGPMVEGFLDREKERIALALLVVDARREPMESDRMMRDWLDARGIPWVAVAVKADKLTASERGRAGRAIGREFGDGDGGDARPVMVSAKDTSGIRELWRHLDVALAASGAA
jgi:GTP-binding protein